MRLLRFAYVSISTLWTYSAPLFMPLLVMMLVIWIFQWSERRKREQEEQDAGGAVQYTNVDQFLKTREESTCSSTTDEDCSAAINPMESTDQPQAPTDPDLNPTAVPETRDQPSPVTQQAHKDEEQVLTSLQQRDSLEDDAQPEAPVKNSSQLLSSTEETDNPQETPQSLDPPQPVTVDSSPSLTEKRSSLSDEDSGSSGDFRGNFDSGVEVDTLSNEDETSPQLETVGDDPEEADDEEGDDDSRITQESDSCCSDSEDEVVSYDIGGGDDSDCDGKATENSNDGKAPPDTPSTNLDDEQLFLPSLQGAIDALKVSSPLKSCLKDPSAPCTPVAGTPEDDLSSSKSKVRFGEIRISELAQLGECAGCAPLNLDSDDDSDQENDTPDTDSLPTQTLPATATQ